MISSIFKMGGSTWHVRLVSPDDPMLNDRTGIQTVATTDPITNTVYLSTSLHGEFFTRVLIHEMGHVAMIEFGLIDDIHRLVPEKNWIEMEEWCCNLLADYGTTVLKAIGDVAGDDIYNQLPSVIGEFARKIA